MPISPVLLALCLGALVWFVRNDRRDYRAFKLLTETEDRQKQYRAWLIKSVLLMTCTAVAALAILGRLRALAILPPEFRSLRDALHASGLSSGAVTEGLIAGALGAVAGGIILRFFAGRFFGRKAKPVYAGDIAALIPRNSAETLWAALLSVNAGIGEEIYFRLLLPLLLMTLCHQALAAFAIACLIFGAVHLYQGVAGILATTVIGGFMAGLYLLSGKLWVPMAAHALLDLVGLVIRPTLQRMTARRGAGEA
jgi:membrane protease YdiL (CAAX protease family)